ncbi:MAG TPA: hypothetical protein VK920_08000 [Solirubrobacterales bacterium]|nr:hypothetical protein [Solirubrobacterales bacterium]
MTSAEPIDVVRRINDAFAAAPFEQVRAVSGETDIEGAASLTEGLAPGRDVWWRCFRASAALGDPLS